MAMRPAALIMAVLVATSVAACGSGNPISGGSGMGEVVIGSANFTESELLMEIDAEALRASGVEVRTRPRLGTREITNRALADGSITMIPEYTGNLLYFLDPASTATAPDDVYAALRKVLPPGLRVLEPSMAEDSDVLVLTQESATRLGVTSMEALGPVCGQLTLGAAGEWPARWKDKIAQLYGCTFRQILSTDSGGPVTVEKLRSGEAQVVNLFTTSPDIVANRWVALADPKHLYPAQRIVTLVRAGALDQAGIDALNRVSARLTTAKLTELNRRITQNHEAVAELAKEFVKGSR